MYRQNKQDTVSDFHPKYFPYICRIFKYVWQGPANFKPGMFNVDLYNDEDFILKQVGGKQVGKEKGESGMNGL